MIDRDVSMENSRMIFRFSNGLPGGCVQSGNAIGRSTVPYITFSGDITNNMTS